MILAVLIIFSFAKTFAETDRISITREHLKEHSISRSISYAQLLIHTYENQNSFFNDAPAYGVLMSNCMQASAMVMQASNPIYENPIAYLHFASLCMYVVPSVVARLLEISGFPTVHTSTNSGAGIDIPR